MSTFFYDFNTKKQVNPLDGITHFFVNPYMPESFRALNLGNKIINNQVETDLVIQESTGTQETNLYEANQRASYSAY